ncbi:MAG TPA: DUF4190 domain-containing protein [Nocardioidaceae bacterium]|nr:DUF4190 domain-containing protein [Nocardioidaceae bacterium]
MTAPPPPQGPPGPGGGYWYGQQPGWPPPAGQLHPRATLSLVLGLVALAGGIFTGVLLLVGPFALVIGHRTLREIDGSEGWVTGRSEAMTGYVLGIIATVLLVLAVLVFVLFLVVFFAVASSTIGP